VLTEVKLHALSVLAGFEWSVMLRYFSNGRFSVCTG